MSWGCFNVMKCKKCGYEYIVENDTLSLNMSASDNCPICKSEGEVISSNSMLTAMNRQKELFKNRKKIKIIGCDLCNYNCKECLFN